MNILCISNYKANFEGNFINQLKNISKKVELEGGKIVFCFPEDAKIYEWYQELASSYSVYCMPNPRLTNLVPMINMLKKICKNEKIDIIHSHFDGYDIAAYYAMENKGNVIWHFRNSLDISRLNLIKRIYASILIYLKYNIFSKHKKMIFLSDSYRLNEIQNGKITEEKSTVIPNGINIDILTIDKLNRNKILKKYHIKNENKNILTFGGDYYRKGIDIIINSFRNSNLSEYNLLIVASKEVEDEIMSIHKILNNENIYFLRPTSKVINYYCIADLFISASRKETFCNAIAEAAYAGIDVLSSDIEGVEWARDIPIVNFFPVNNEQELTNHLINFKPSSRDNIKKSQEKIRMKYSNQTWAEKIWEFYNCL